MKLELKHLAPYLPYNLKFVTESGNPTDAFISINGCGVTKKRKDMLRPLPVDVSFDTFVRNYRPILRPLSDLTKEIEHNGERFVPVSKILNEPSPNYYPLQCYEQDKRALVKGDLALNLPYQKVEQMISWHFDVFGLIEKGIAINLNSIK